MYTTAVPMRERKWAKVRACLISVVVYYCLLLLYVLYL